MTKLVLSLLFVALAGLVGCASDPVTPAPAPVVVAPAASPPPTVVVQAPTHTVVPAPTAIRPGFGRIESITPVPPTAAAGGTTHQRLGIKMDDGTVQYVDTSAQGYAVGDRIELTRDGHIRKA
jgi:hypothetical protein